MYIILICVYSPKKQSNSGSYLGSVKYRTSFGGKKLKVLLPFVYREASI